MAIANSHIYGEDRNKLYPIASIGFTEDIYSNVKSAIENPGIKNKLLSAFTDFVKLAQQGKCFDVHFDAHKEKSQELIDCILEHPKIIVERDFFGSRSPIYDVAVSAIESLGEIRLPFPKITIIGGERVNKDFPDETDEVIVQDGSVNLLYSFFLTQDQDRIIINALFSKPNEIGKSYFIAHCVLHFVEGRLKMSKPFVARKHKYELAEPETMDNMSYLAIIAVYMLTIAGGDMYVSAPTPDEIAINKKRMNKGKKPLIEFRLITVDGKKSALPSMPQGTHASPRLHWRRGHWRTMKKSGKKVWIDPMLVGDEENGKIIKDYAVGNYKENRAV